MANTVERWDRESKKGKRLKFATATTRRLMMPLLDTGTAGRRASFASMINSSGRDTDIRKNFLTLRNVRQ